MTTLAPAAWEEIAERVARHIGTTLNPDGTMPCPKCGGDYGPTIPVFQLGAYELGYLPGTPLLIGVCLDCCHIVEPVAHAAESGGDDRDTTTITPVHGIL